MLSLFLKGISQLPLVTRDDSVHMKLPKQAKRVFTGEIFDVYQWPQKMFDGSIETFEMLKRPDTVQVIATRKNKIIISFERQPQLKKSHHTFFGGRIENRESPLQAAKRELEEESGMTSKNWSLIGAEQPVQKLDWTIYTFIARNCQKKCNQNLDAGEKIKILEISFDKFINLILDNKFYRGGFTFDLLKMKLNGTLHKFKQKLFKRK